MNRGRFLSYVSSSLAPRSVLYFRVVVRRGTRDAHTPHANYVNWDELCVCGACLFVALIDLPYYALLKLVLHGGEESLY